MAGEKRTDWRTPRELFDLINSSINDGEGCAVDAAADSSNHLVPDWYGPGSVLGEDALAIPVWASPAWCNPPYDRDIKKWLHKFIQQQAIGKTIIALLPAKTDTNWWHDMVVPYADTLFLKGRVAFEPADDALTDFNPKFASALCIYHSAHQPTVKWLDWRKAIAIKAVRDAQEEDDAR